jgi:glycosyltransferase involved in cell wall biosynthesis
MKINTVSKNKDLAAKNKLIRITTIPMALKFLLPGQMKFMQANGFDVLMISADGIERNSVMENEGCPHTIVPMTRKITPFKDLNCLWQLIKIFKKEKPDIVHTHTPKAGLLGMLAAKICGVRVRIHTVAGLPLMVETGFKFQLLKIIEKITFWGANHVWPNSNSLLNYIVEHNLSSQKKLKVISKGSSNGIDLARFSKANFDNRILNDVKIKINYSSDHTYLLTIGRLVKDKGIIELVETFKIINASYTKTKLVLVGKFEEELDPLPSSIIEEIKSNVNIIHIDWSQYVEYYISIANVFIFPSHREGFPNVLLQSGALGTPIVCSAIAGNIDIVEDNKTGLLFPVGDRESLKNKIIFALEKSGEMQKMATILQSNITKYYSRENIWNALLLEYKTLTIKNG